MQYFEAGYDLDYWELDGFSTGSQNPTTVMMESDHTLNAVFKLTYELTITTTRGGTKDPSPGTHPVLKEPRSQPQRLLTRATLLTIGSDGYWSYSNPIDVTMDANHTLHAVLDHAQYCSEGSAKELKCPMYSALQ